jgi:hypothetical protein
MINNKYGQAVSICYTAEEFNQTKQYQANAHVGLFETHYVDDGIPADSWMQVKVQWKDLWLD